MAVLSVTLKAACYNHEYQCARGEPLRDVDDSRSALGLLFDFMKDVMSGAQEFIASNGGKKTYFLGRLTDDSFENLLRLEEVINKVLRVKAHLAFRGVRQHLRRRLAWRRTARPGGA